MARCWTPVRSARPTRQPRTYNTRSTGAACCSRARASPVRNKKCAKWSSCAAPTPAAFRRGASDPMTDDDRSPSPGRSLLELAGVVLLLAIWAGALYRLAGAPDLARLPAWPGWEELVALARSRAVPLDGVMQVTILVQWVICGGLAAWLVLSVTVELLLGVAELGPAKGAS